MFPHDPVAKKYSCGRTKTTAVMKACANDQMDATAADMKSGPFILGTDGSQEGEEKYFLFVARRPEKTLLTDQHLLLTN